MILLDSVEAVRQRFDLVPKEGVSFSVNTSDLQAQFIAVEYIEQVVDGLIDFDKDIAQELLERLPVINV